MPPKTVTHYEVLEQLGQGGMGTVYLGRDLRLQRPVALKFLSSDQLSSADSRARFLREGQALSSLSHPYIATVYEVDEADGVPFLALEYLPGGTLGARVRAASEAHAYLPVADVLAWGAGLAEALAHAHRNGVIHRDVKSSNVMFDGEGRVKLTDFGLAKVTASPGLSASGFVVGTFAYMSPEQVTGEPVDHRSDLFSLGVLLYELATGRLPFSGDTPAAILHQVLNATPPPPSELRPDLPKGFDRVVAGLLAKDLASRCQLADDAARELRSLQEASRGSGAQPSTITMRPFLRPKPRARRVWLAAIAGLVVLLVAFLAFRDQVALKFQPWFLPPQKNVVVLPFRNIGGEADQQAFCDGLTETLTTALTKHGSLSVVPPSDARRLESAEQARREFGVNLVLYGSVQRRGNQVRVIISLIDAQRRRQIDSEPIDWPYEKLIDLEEGVLTKVGDLLNLVLTEAPRDVMAAGATQLPAAHDAYLRGRGFLYRFDKAGNLERAQQQFEDAIRADPKFAAAHVGLSETYLRAYRLRKDADLILSARSEAHRARELSPQLASARVALGAALTELRQQAEAAQELEAAMKLDPRDPAVYRELARLYASMGRNSEAEAVYQKAIGARPGDWTAFNSAALFYLSLHRFDEADRHFRKAAQLTPDSPTVYRNWGAMLMKQGKLREAEQVLMRAQTLNPSATGYANLATLLMLQSRYKDAVPLAERAAALGARQTPNEPRIWGNLGDAYWLAQTGEGKAQEAWRKAAEIAEREASRAQTGATNLILLAKFQAKLGETAKALESVEKAQKLEPDSSSVHYQAGLTYAVLGQNDLALRELGAALERKHPLEEIQRAPELAGLREDPRYRQLVEKAGNR